MSVPTYNPLCCDFTRVYLLVKGIEYLEKCFRGLLRATRGIKIFAMISLHRDLKAIEGPSEYLIERLCIRHHSVARSDLRARLSPDDSQYRMRRGPVPARVTVPHVHSHPASDTFCQGPARNYHMHVRNLISHNIPGCSNTLSHHRSKRQSDHECARLPCHTCQPRIR
jgi:hypothetical protein